MEIYKLLTVSTESISETTRALLKSDENWESNADLPALPFVTYAKGSYGWFLSITDFYSADDAGKTDCPHDLRTIIEYALQRGCDWLCFDPDAPLFDP